MSLALKEAYCLKYLSFIEKSKMSFLCLLSGYSAPTSPCPDTSATGETVCDGPDASNPTVETDVSTLTTQTSRDSNSSETKVSKNSYHNGNKICILDLIKNYHRFQRVHKLKLL